MKLAAALLICLSSVSLGQTPEVPHKMQFAGMTLTIRDDARREIQKDVDMLTQSPKHLNIKVERAKTYFPIIEKIFEEERIPDDFKYLVLQESALISDAVSVSNAVGFWQFKDFTAIEMGLRVDKVVDERMNIAAASRGAARYLKKNNYYFNNWIYALQAYQMGAGGVMKSVKDYESGTKHMEITSKTYWYVKKFLAHKVAFENVVKGMGEIKVFTVVNHTHKSMSELAKDFAVDEQELKNYNKWVRKDYVPGDRPYTIAIPTTGDNRILTNAVAKATKSHEQPTRVEAKPAMAKSDVLMINGIMAMKVHSGENTTAFVKRAGVDLSYFLKCNDLSISDKLMAGDYYYLKKKKTKASVPQHMVKPGDNLWSISQQYGVQLRKLRKYNNTTNNSVSGGSMIYLSSKKVTTKNLPMDMEIVEVDADATFNWVIEPMTLETFVNPVPIESVDSEIKAGSAVETLALKSSQHTVMAGETLYSIAKRYQVGVMDIVQWNNLKLEDGINPGQVLDLQIAEETVLANLPSAPEIVHQVKPSDTLYSVARQYGVTIKELMDWNQKTNFTLVVGENLKILKP